MMIEILVSALLAMQPMQEVHDLYCRRSPAIHPIKNPKPKRPIKTIKLRKIA